MSRDDYVLVTGATGFVGVNVVKFLAGKGCRVLGLDITRPDPLIEDYLADAKRFVEWAVIDLTDAENVMRLADRYRLRGVIHAAVFTTASREEERARPREILASTVSRPLS